MDVIGLYLAHTAWFWVGASALFLAVEVGTGTSYLLWPSASAAAVAILTLLVRTPVGIDFAIFALLTIATTLVARRYFPQTLPSGPDINDPHHRLHGKHGTAVGPFIQGEGRVFVDGKEWAAECDADLATGDRIVVATILDGGKLKVRGS